MNMSSPRLHLHLGPPKTGTTSLQIAAQSAELSWLVYGGACQPRETDTGSLSHRLHAIARGSVAMESTEARLIRAEIEGVLASGQHLFISEEMFLVSESGIPFQEKLTRLADLLAGVPVSVVVTLRDPKEGLASYYQEIYSSLPIRHQLSFGAFCRADRAQCFDYGLLLQRLREMGFTDIHLLTFSDIASGLIPYTMLFGSSISATGDFSIGTHNISAKDDRTGRRSLPAISLRAVSNRLFRSVSNRLWMGRLSRACGFGTTAVYQRVSKWAGGVSLLPRRNRRLEVPRDVGERLTTEFVRLVATMPASSPSRS